MPKFYDQQYYKDNVFHVDDGVILRGIRNELFTVRSFVGDGDYNKLHQNGNKIIFGDYNVTNAKNATIFAGNYNNVTGKEAIVHKGNKNNLMGEESSVVQGNENVLINKDGSVIYGNKNNTTGNGQVISGNENRVANKAVVINGDKNTIAESCKVIGDGNSTTHKYAHGVMLYGEVSYINGCMASNYIPSTIAAAKIEYILRAKVLPGVPTVLTVDGTPGGSSAFGLGADTVYTFRGTFVIKQGPLVSNLIYHGYMKTGKCKLVKYTDSPELLVDIPVTVEMDEVLGKITVTSPVGGDAAMLLIGVKL
jgi:hypothetical protein